MRQEPHTSDMPTFHIEQDSLKEVLRFLKYESKPSYKRLDDLTAIDESARRERIWNKDFAGAITDTGAAESYSQMAKRPYPDFTLVYQLLSFDSASRLRIKSGLNGAYPATGSVTDIWPSANWYEREVFDMFGITIRRPSESQQNFDAPMVGRPPAQEGLPGAGNADASIYLSGCPKAPAHGRPGSRGPRP